jgi:hypothetical protein
MVWTHFWDMHSGGPQKLEWAHIFIEAPEEEAKSVFYSRFGRNPERVSCTCCGEDYSISEFEDLQQATAFHRGCRFDTETGKYGEKSGPKKHTFYTFIPFEDFLKNPMFKDCGEKNSVLLIYKDSISKGQRSAKVPQEGYVWAGDY